MLSITERNAGQEAQNRDHPVSLAKAMYGLRLRAPDHLEGLFTQ